MLSILVFSCRRLTWSLAVLALCGGWLPGLETSLFAADPAPAKREPIPHAQDKPPGPPLSPQEAVAKMAVPEGFAVELVASEPDLVNPVAMTFDERGRVWVTESLEYPRHSAGPGRDRIKIMEDTDGDGAADKFTIFAEGLNIPSGIAVGHGGVWVANSPDLLFLQDTDGDGRADKQEVVVTGFGRADTHELPNSLTWGPDGWLYGINGVFNPSKIEYRGQTHEFTCALFRIHPRTRDFEVFAEGTSNPWGVAFDNEGSAFFSACVIDHLWHITESGYYHRQGGPYPPHTWKIESIVKHKHQKAAYCGITFFDSNAYPAEYRERLYMGNIHGGCINVDVLERDGSTYFAKPADDFLTANDAWFMPVVQKTGPDGCLYVLDWYDRYHCYQDAGRDPEGIDRLRGRLYRVCYKDVPRRTGFDLSKSSDAELLKLLGSANVYDRDMAQRLLTERVAADSSGPAAGMLKKLIADGNALRKARMHGLWAMTGGGTLDVAMLLKLMSHDDPGFRAWGVRAAGNMRNVPAPVCRRVEELAGDPSADVRLQVAIAARKIDGLDAVDLLADVLETSGEDKLIPHIVWQNVHPLLEEDSDRFVALLRDMDPPKVPGVTAIMPRLIERVIARKQFDAEQAERLYDLVAGGTAPDTSAARLFLGALARKTQTREIAGEQLAALQQRMSPRLLQVLLADPSHPLQLDAALLLTTWKDPAGLAAVRATFANREQPEPLRLAALEALVAAADIKLLDSVEPALTDPQPPSVQWPALLLAALGRLEDPRVADIVASAYPKLAGDLQPKAIELLTQRATWSKRLLAAIGDKQIPADALNVNQVRKLLAGGDEELAAAVQAVWGTLREDRNPQREEVIARMRTFLRANPGNPHAGQAVFKKVCGQCHKMYGEGQEVGPDITLNGRSSYAQLLSNVFDPSLVIGAAYQARTLVTNDGRVLLGLLVEESDERVVLKLQGGKLETVPRGDIDEFEISKLSMMPEGVEKQLKPEELADLFAYITLDKPPTDPAARQLPGLRELLPRETLDSAAFNEILGEVAPGFRIEASGERGVGLVAKHFGREGVVRTHPVNQKTPAVLHRQVEIPAGGQTELVVQASHDHRGDWQLVVRANGKTLHESIIGAKTTRDGWAEIRVDLTPLAGQTVKLEVENRANDWAWEFGYWAKVDVVTVNGETTP
ncbi:MAG: PVC-type heme-binding CxxCH protein [Pirellulales bacterium]